jgi:hypothetical protein
MTYKNSERRHEIFKSALLKLAKDDEKLLFSTLIVKYNTYIVKVLNDVTV